MSLSPVASQSARSLKIVVALVAIIAIPLTCTTYAALTTSNNIYSIGEITATPSLGIYSGSACQAPITMINWGTLAPGTNLTTAIYVKNTGSDVLLSLSSATSVGENKLTKIIEEKVVKLSKQ